MMRRLHALYEANATVGDKSLQLWETQHMSTQDRRRHQLLGRNGTTTRRPRTASDVLNRSLSELKQVLARCPVRCRRMPRDWRHSDANCCSSGKGSARSRDVWKCGNKRRVKRPNVAEEKHFASGQDTMTSPWMTFSVLAAKDARRKTCRFFGGCRTCVPVSWWGRVAISSSFWSFEPKLTQINGALLF